jgi:bromodomain-containing protein 7/9
MGKKHKKHHKHDRFGTEGSERPLKLVLKVGGSADSGFTSKAIVVPPAAAESPIRNGSSVTAPLVQRDTAFRGDHFVPQSAPPSLSVQVREDDITKKKKKKKKKHRHADEGDFHPTLVPSYRPEEQEQLARLYHHHPPVIEVHRSMYAGGEHRHHHKHRKHHRHHHHHDRLERKQRFVDHVSAGSSLDGYELDEYYDTPMVSSGHGLKISFKRDLSMTKTFEPPTKKFSPATPPGFFIDPTIPARVTRSQDVPGFEERNRLDRVKDKELKKLLLRFLNALQRKDVHQFFALPVSDKIAPGYSTVIKYPMDFHRMRLKIDRAEYRSVDEFKDDLELICTNCTTYNASDTVYYKAAVKLLEYGIKLMKDSLTPSRRNMPPHLSASLQITQSSVAGLVGVPRPTDEDFIDVDNIDETSGASLLSERSKRYGLVDWMNCSSPDQEGIEDQVMEQTVKAARTVAGKLEEQCPNSKIGFLSTDVSGSTSLRILNPDRDKENVPVSVDLGSLVGLVRNGTSKLADAREETKDLVIPVSYLFYGPFTSFAPSYDSSRANLTKEESDLLLSSYTDATGVQFAHRSVGVLVQYTGGIANNIWA